MAARIKGIWTSILALIFGVGAAAEIHEDIKAQELACAVPLPSEPTAQACRDQEPAKAHPHEERAPLPSVDPFPLPLRNAAATVFASENVPQRGRFVQVDQQGRNHALLDQPPSASRPPLEPPPEHIEPENPGTAARIGQLSGISTTVSQSLGALINSTPQPFENPAPLIWSPSQRGTRNIIDEPRVDGSAAA
jgi:hypothetical protein